MPGKACLSRPAGRPVLRHQAAAVRNNNLLCDPKPKSVPLRFSGEIRIKDKRQPVGRNPRPIVAHHHANFPIRYRCVHPNPALALHGLESIDHHVQQRLGQADRIRHHLRQRLLDLGRNGDVPRRRLRAQQLAHVGDNPGDFDRRQIHPRRPGQPEKPLDNPLQSVQLAVNDFQARRQWLAHLRRQRSQVFLQQLQMDVERAQRVADFVRQPPQQPRQQVPLLRRSRLRRLLAQRLCHGIFHWL